MAFQPGISGNPTGKAKEKLFHDVLNMELKAAGDDHRALRAIARNVIKLAQMEDGLGLAAAKEIANRLDGMPTQQQDVNVNERVTVIHAPLPKASTEEWKQSLTTSPNMTLTGDLKTGHKLNS